MYFHSTAKTFVTVGL